MKTIIKLFSFVGICILIVIGCRPKQELSITKPVQVEGKSSTLAAILRTPINSADKKEIESNIYMDKTYLILQNQEDRFKDNAPFIEYLDGGKKERLWFASSRADTVLFNGKRTNRYQQIYYCEREVGKGQGPKEGWGLPTLLSTRTDNPFMADVVAAFNKSTKGAATIANNIMILSCDQISATGNSEFKDLWEIARVDGAFTNPKPLQSLSNTNTWESQPALSPNGKHLFFVSNRKVNPSDFSYKNEVASNQINILYSFKENGQ
ncbi:MAG: hypothetical protein NTV01_07325 [Bacteroidia bacterium]|nr:hypothetical protein [Bacteroidia bacterium]